MNTDDLVPGCFPCDQQAEVALPPREDVVHTDHWRVAHAFNSTLPGWLVRRLGAALEAVTGCVKTHLLQFSEAEGFSHLTEDQSQWLPTKERDRIALSVPAALSSCARSSAARADRPRRTEA